MKNTTIYRFAIAITILVFWWYSSGTLTEKPELTLRMLPIPLGVLTALAIIIQLLLKKGMKTKMKEILDDEIEESREDLTKELKKLVSYLEQTKYPTYSESGVKGLEDAFRRFDSIKSRYTFEPKILKSTILIILSSLFLVLFSMTPESWVYVTEDGYTFTLAHVGIGLFAFGIWMIVDMLITSLEIQPWEK